MRSLSGQGRTRMKKKGRLNKQTKMRKGGTVSPTKAKKILADGKIRGVPLTSKQRGFFGAKAAGK